MKNELLQFHRQQVTPKPSLRGQAIKIEPVYKLPEGLVLCGSNFRSKRNQLAWYH